MPKPAMRDANLKMAPPNQPIWRHEVSSLATALRMHWNYFRWGDVPLSWGQRPDLVGKFRKTNADECRGD
jgi:hypothetical protein